MADRVTYSSVSELGEVGVDPHRIELFVRLIGLHQNQVHRYVLSLVPNAHDADDLVQNTNLFLWREFDRFQEGTNFVAWACAVAYHEVLAWRKTRSRDRLVFSELFLSEVSTQLVSSDELLEQRSQLLNQCISSLPSHHQELLQLRYANRATVESIAEQQGRSCDAIYRMLSRIRHALYQCVHRKMEFETP